MFLTLLLFPSWLGHLVSMTQLLTLAGVLAFLTL